MEKLVQIVPDQIDFPAWHLLKLKMTLIKMTMMDLTGECCVQTGDRLDAVAEMMDLLCWIRDLIAGRLAYFKD